MLHHLSAHTLLGVIDQGTVGPLSPTSELSGFRHSSACSGGRPKGLNAKLCLPLLTRMSPPHPNFVPPAATEGQASPAGPKTPPVPSGVRCCPHRQDPGSQNPCTSPLPTSPAPQGTAERTPEPRRGVTLTFPHHRLQPQGRHLPLRSSAASGSVPRWGRGPARHPRGPHPVGSSHAPLRTWSRLPVLCSLGSSVPAAPLRSTSGEGTVTGTQTDSRQSVCALEESFMGVLSVPLLAHTGISLPSANGRAVKIFILPGYKYHLVQKCFRL